MRDPEKSTEQLLTENEALRGRVAALEDADVNAGGPRENCEPAKPATARWRNPPGISSTSSTGKERSSMPIGPPRNASASRPASMPGKRQAELFPPEMAQAHIGKIAGVFASGEPMDQDDCSISARKKFGCGFICCPCRMRRESHGGDGRGHNITERKRRRRSLAPGARGPGAARGERTADLAKANEELAIFRLFAETSAQGFSMADLDGYITYANPALCRILGYQGPEEVVGMHLSTHFSDASNRLGEQEIRPALSQRGHWEGELTMLSQRGTSVPTWHHTSLIRDDRGKPLRMAVVISDITERKRAEESLRQSHEQLQAIYEGIVDGLLITDIESKRFMHVNSAMCRMLGYSRAELLAASIHDIHPREELPNDLLRFQAAAEGRVSINEDRPVLRKDGSIFYADITGHRILYEGRPCLLALFRDISERKAARSALERERRTLEHMLRASDHERQLIAYDIHDGLAQQLAGSLMQFQVCDCLRDGKPAEARAAFDRGVALLRQGHFEARRLISGVRPPILDESGVVAAVAHLVNEMTLDERPRVEFQSKVRFDRLAPVVENVIYRIVQEGLANAARHSRSEIVRIGLWQRGDRVRIAIRDWGVGFNPKTVGRHRFGLKGIRERARLLGGTCRIRSRAGAGTTIRVELPLAELRPAE